jgi:Nuclease-related domain
MTEMPIGSPLKAKPLRNPGDSLDREIESWVGDTVMSYYVVAALLTFLACTEWLGYLSSSPRHPILYSVAAGIALATFGVRFTMIRARVQRLKLGRDGERCVGQFLERLRESEALIFHDVPAEGFNLDHVVISPHGIFVIETKTHSKPYSDARVTVEGDQLRVAGRQLDRDPMVQVASAARWLEKLLTESTGRSFKVRPVVVFPGWYVEQPDPRGHIWVLEPKMLPALIDRETLRLAMSDVRLAAFHLSRYIRTEVDKAA